MGLYRYYYSPLAEQTCVFDEEFFVAIVKADDAAYEAKVVAGSLAQLDLAITAVKAAGLTKAAAVFHYQLLFIIFF